MKKILRSSIAILLALLLGMLAVAAAVLILPTQFDRSYLGELTDMYTRLRSFDALGENKIIIIGGSSVSFGVNTEMIEENLGIPAVNFGLYGPLGTAVMMDLTRGHIHEGDIVVLAPEMDRQTMSMSFNAEAMWDACDSDYTMLFQVRFRNWDDMLGSFWTYAQQKYQFYKNGKPQPEGIYSHSSFNDHSDIVFLRSESIMPNGYDPDVPVDLDPSIIDREYIDYVNDYVDYCESRGAAVYFSWPPMNELAIPQDEQGILEFATFVRENFRCRLISDITDYIMDAEYFYDTNYHMTDAGTARHTARLIQDIENAAGRGKCVNITIPETLQTRIDIANGVAPADSAAADDEPLPDSGSASGESSGEASDLIPEPIPEVVGSSRDAEYFLAEPYNDEGLMVTGVTDEGKTKTSLEVPWLIDGQKVLAIGSNTFAGCDSLTSIYIQPNIIRIMQDAFDGAPRLAEIHIDNTQGGNILIPGVDLFEGVPGRVRVYVPADSFGNFLADYFWGNYNDRIVREP